MLLDSVKEMLAEHTARVYISQVDETYPPYPYAILAEGQESVIDASLAREFTAGGRDLFVTLVDNTPNNVHLTRAAVRATLNPGGMGQRIDGAFVKLVPHMCSPLAQDKDNGQDRDGEYPYFAVDVYSIER